MLRIIVSFLVKSLTPTALIALGELLIAAGQEVQRRQLRTNEALALVRQGVNSLTEK